MIAFIYLLKMIGSSAILSCYYYFFLRNRRFHNYNRYFILLIFLLSILLPLIQIPFINDFFPADSPGVFKPISGVTLPEVVLRNARGSNAFILWFYLLISFYFFIVCAVCVKLARSVIQLVNLTKKYPAKLLGDVTLFSTHEPDSPFSFFQWIFWNNRLDIHSRAGRQVLRHELYHVKQRHSFDMLFVEITLAIYWFNPFFYFLKTELKAIHEFLADKSAVAGEGKFDYAEMLLLHAVSVKKNRLTHSFFQNQIKRRIAMITETNKNHLSYLRRVMALPLLFFLCFACSRNVEKAKPLSDKVKAENTNDKMFIIGRTGDTIEILPEALINLIKQDSSVSNLSVRENAKAYISYKYGPVYSFNLKELEAYAKAHKELDDETFVDAKNAEAQFAGGSSMWAKYLNKNFRYPQEAIDKEIQGTVLMEFSIDEKGNLSNIKALSGPKILSYEALRILRESGRWIPAVRNGQPVRSVKTQPITFRLSQE